MKLNLCFTLLYLCGDGSLGAVAGAAIEGVTETQIDTSNMGVSTVDHEDGVSKTTRMLRVRDFDAVDSATLVDIDVEKLFWKKVSELEEIVKQQSYCDVSSSCNVGEFCNFGSGSKNGGLCEPCPSSDCASSGLLDEGVSEDKTSSQSSHVYGIVSAAMMYGFVLNDISLCPISNHKGLTTIFDKKMLQQTMNTNFVTSTRSYAVNIMEETISSFSKKLDDAMHLSGSASSAWLGGTLGGIAGTEFGMEAKDRTEYYYYQNRNQYEYGDSQLPFRAEDKSEIQSLLHPSTLNALRGITSIERALEVVKYMGVGYINSVTFGATFVTTSKIEKRDWMDANYINTEMSSSYESFIGAAASGATSTSKSFQKNEYTMKSIVTLETLGGKPELMGNKEQWLESIAMNPAIIEYSVMPLYELLSPHGYEEDARNILKQAVDQYVEDFEGNLPWYDWRILQTNSLNIGIQTSPTFSDEGSGYSREMPGPIHEIRCRKKRCDDKVLVSIENKSQPIIKREDSYWSNWFSEEHIKQDCHIERVVTQIQCKGDNCDDMRLKCSSVEKEYFVDNAETYTSARFSEEEGSGRCKNGYYITGMECYSDDCDTIALHCTRVKYQYQPNQV